MTYIVPPESIEVSNNVDVTVTNEPDVIVTNNVDTTVTNFPDNGLVSTNNSTTSTLTASSTFTGTGEDVSEYSSATTTVYADVSGYVQVEQSSDNSNWDVVKYTTVAAATGVDVSSLISANYFRIKYTNDTTNQATFRLQTVFHKSKPYAPLPADYLSEAAVGNIPGEKTVIIVGINRNTSATVEESITDSGGVYTYLTADTQLYVSSSSASDTNVDITVTGLDDNYIERTWTVNTNGQSQIAISDSNTFRVFTFAVTGSTSPVGEMYLAETDTLTAGVPDTATKIKAKIPFAVDIAGGAINTGTDRASENISHLGLYTVPVGKQFLIQEIITGSAKNVNAKISGRVRLFGGSWWSRNPIHVYQSQVSVMFSPPLVLPAKSDVEWTAITGVAGGEAQIQTLGILQDIY